MTEEQAESPLQAAQKRLADAALGVPMNPQSASIAAYVNGILQSARVDALVELHITPPNASWSREEAYEATLLRALTDRALTLELKAEEVKRQIAENEKRIEVATTMPGSVAAAVRNMTRN